MSRPCWVGGCNTWNAPYALSTRSRGLMFNAHGLFSSWGVRGLFCHGYLSALHLEKVTLVPKLSWIPLHVLLPFPLLVCEMSRVRVFSFYVEKAPTFSLALVFTIYVCIYLLWILMYITVIHIILTCVSYILSLYVLIYTLSSIFHIYVSDFPAKLSPTAGLLTSPTDSLCSKRKWEAEEVGPLALF